jgi:DNA end-binding protein Ku
MAARAIWSGAITFGLVNVPIRMYSAIDEKDLRFNLLHVKDGSRIGYEKICKDEGVPVPDGEISTAYEVSKGEYVYLDDDDFARAAGPLGRTIDLADFVPYGEIDPIYFERTYYLGPAEGYEKVYVLLTTAMKNAGLAGIATYVMRKKQHLGCIRVRDDVLTLSKMFFADEIRPIEGLPSAGDVPVGARELEMATELIERFTGPFEPDKYHDVYREALLDVIRAKQKGSPVKDEPQPETRVPDLMEALRASLDAHQGKPSRGKTRADELPSLSKAALARRAKESGVTGYSQMTKAELVAALS